MEFISAKGEAVADNLVPMQPPEYGAHHFYERIFPSLGATSALLALIGAMAFAIWAALGSTIALAFALIGLALIAIWFQSAIHLVTCDGKKLRVNEAEIELYLVGDINSLQKNEWRERIGANFNPTAFHAHRFWMKSGVAISIRDSKDPHPEWIIGTNQPDQLKAALTGPIRPPG